MSPDRSVPTEGTCSHQRFRPCKALTFSGNDSHLKHQGWWPTASAILLAVMSNFPWSTSNAIPVPEEDPCLSKTMQALADLRALGPPLTAWDTNGREYNDQWFKVRRLARLPEISCRRTATITLEHARAFESLGTAISEFQHFERSLSWLEWALRIRQGELPPHDLEIASSHWLLGNALASSGQHEQARQQYEAALRIGEVGLPPSDPMLGQTLRRIGDCYYARQQFHSAMVPYSLAIQQLETADPSDPVALAVALQSRGQAAAALGQLTSASEDGERALAILAEQTAPDSSAIVWVRTGLAQISRMRGDFTTALSHLRLAESALDSGAVAPPQAAYIWKQFADLYNDLGKFDLADTYDDRATRASSPRAIPLGPVDGTSYARYVESFRGCPVDRDCRDIIKERDQLRQIYPAQGWVDAADPILGVEAGNLGFASLRVDNCKAAARYYDEARTIFEAIYGPRSLHVGDALFGLAQADICRNRFETALQYLSEALSIFLERLGPTHSRTAGATFAYGSTLWALGRQTEAIFFGKQSVNSLQATRSTIKTLDRDLQTSFVHSYEDIYRDVASWLLDVGRLPEAEQVLRMLKEYEHFNFTRGTSQSGGDTRSSCSRGEQPSCERYEETANDLFDLARNLALLEAEVSIRGEPSEEQQARIESLRNDLAAARRASSQFLYELRKQFEQMPTQRIDEFIGDQLSKYHQLSRELEQLANRYPGVVVLQYLVTKTRLHILVIPPAPVKPKHYTSSVQRKELNDAVLQFRNNLEGNRAWSAQGELSQTLYHWLFPRELQQYLDALPAKELMVSLDDSLRYLPIAALYDGQHYLIERYALAVYPPGANVALAAPPMDEWKVAALAATQKTEEFGEGLTTARKEIEYIVRQGDDEPTGLFPGRRWIDGEFDAAALSDAVDRFDVVHISSHFRVKPGNIVNSALLLGNSETLSLADLQKGYKWDGLQLVAFAACETAMGELGGDGVEVESLGVTVLKKGARAVLATLWSVPDSSTGPLVMEFYRQKSLGLSKAHALQRAQIGMLKGESWSPQMAFRAPYWWAGISIMGNWL